VVCGEEEGGGFSGGGGGEGMTVERDSGSLVRVRVTLIAGWTAGCYSRSTLSGANPSRPIPWWRPAVVGCTGTSASRYKWRFEVQNLSHLNRSSPDFNCSSIKKSEI
jgi:hypothetical protein